MKIGFEVKPFNYNLKSRRLELGYTQKELAFEAQVSVDMIGTLELLKMPPGRMRLVRRRMNRIAKCLEVEFHWLFPQDYLDAIQHKLLPRRKRPIVWICDLDILQLSEDTLYALPSPETEIINVNSKEDIIDAVENALSTLSERERKVIEMRYGIGRNERMTLEEVGMACKVSRGRIQQIQEKALRKLRHPMRSRPLREVQIIEG